MPREQSTASDPVVDAARKLLDGLLPILRENCPGEHDERLELAGWTRWVPDYRIDFGIARRYTALPTFFTAEQQCATRMLGELRQASFQPLVDLDRALAADPVIGPRLDRQVSSSAAGGTTWQAEPMIRQLVDRVIRDAPLFNVPPSWRAAATEQWAGDLRRPSDRMKLILVLHEFRAPASPIELEPGLEIVKLNDAEVAAALQLGAGHAGLRLDERMVTDVFGARRSFESRLFIDGIPAGEGEREVAARQAARERAELVLLALRVFKAGRVRTSGSFEYTLSWGGNEVSPVYGSLGPLFGWHVGEPYGLTNEEAVQFRAFWSAFEQVHARPTIAGALRRFRFAADRVRPDDEIVDLMIAAEALFLRGMDEQYRGELRFRLSSRAASLLGTTLDDRLRLSKFMRRAYDARSAVVHGGALNEDDLRGLDGCRTTVRAFADDLEGVLRDALQTAVRLLASRASFPPNWDELMFALPVP